MCLMSMCSTVCSVLQQVFASICNAYFPFLDVDIPPATSYGVYICQIIRFMPVHLVKSMTLILEIKF